MQIQEERLAILDESVGVPEVCLPLADGLHLGAAQRHAGFEFLEEKVIMAGSPVVRGVALAAGHRVARLGRLFRGRRVFGNDNVAALAGHGRASLSLHPTAKPELPHPVWPSYSVA